MSKRYIHIGSWNIEHFSKVGGRKENIYALAEHIEMASLDILALQEIYVTGTEAGIRRNSDLEKVPALLKEHTGAEWKYEIFQNRSADDTEQLCAVAWNSSVLEKQGDTFRVPVREQVTVTVGNREEHFSLWDRTPHAVKFKAPGRTDLVVVPLHMKANVGGATRPKQIREQEALALMEKLPEIHAALGDKDIVFIGDTNCLASSEPALKVFADHGFEDLNEADSGTYVSGAPFDRIFVPLPQSNFGDPERTIFTFSRQYIMVSANPADHDKYLSDHYLIKTVVSNRRDND